MVSFLFESKSMSQIAMSVEGWSIRLRKHLDLAILFTSTAESYTFMKSVLLQQLNMAVNATISNFRLCVKLKTNQSVLRCRLCASHCFRFSACSSHYFFSSLSSLFARSFIFAGVLNSYKASLSTHQNSDCLSEILAFPPRLQWFSYQSCNQCSVSRGLI